MSDPTRGITCPDMRRVVREALHNGWTWDGFSGTTHARIVWPKTGDRLTFGLTPSVASWKSLATDIRRVSGVQVWRKGNHKRSRKKVTTSGFSIDVARKETRTWHESHDADIAALLDERERHIGACRQAARRRHSLPLIPPLLDVIAHVEKRLAHLGNPVEPFDPFTLGKETPHA